MTLILKEEHNFFKVIIFMFQSMYSESFSAIFLAYWGLLSPLPRLLKNGYIRLPLSRPKLTFLADMSARGRGD